MSKNDFAMQKGDPDVGDAPIREALPVEDDKRILRKVDMCLLPVMALSYFMQFLDKTALGQTAILGLRTDLKLSGDDYSWANSIYYFGYLVATGPFALLMVRWRVAKIIAIAVTAWGVTLMLTAICHNAAGLLAQRFFLGLLEAPIAPGLSIIISMWYKRSEQPLRHATWFMGNSLGGMIGSITAYGIGHIDTISPWKAVFLIFGGVTTAWAIAIFFLLPDTPMSAWFLSPTDRTKAVIRIDDNMTGITSDTFKWYQCWECLIDPKTWLILIINVCGCIPNGAEQGFTTIVIRGFGFSTLNTLLLQSGKYLFQMVLILSTTWASSKLRNTRTYWMAFAFVLAILGVVLIRQLPTENKWGRYSGFILLVSFSANFPLALSMISANYGGYTKKVTMNALYFIAYCAGNIIGPQTFLPQEAPGYTTGFLIILIFFSIGLFTALGLRLYLWKQNRDRDAAGLGAEEDIVDADTLINFLDKTDREIPEFRYVY